MFNKEVEILGIRFIQAEIHFIASKLLNAGGLLVAPSGPGLAQDFRNDAFYRRALMGADIVLPDSGYMVILWNLFQRRSQIKRLSGLKWIRFFVENCLPNIKDSFWVMPTKDDWEANLGWLTRNGVTVEEGYCYLAPYYPRAGDIFDKELLDRIESTKPSVIIINLGGGVQERLGYYLKKQLSYRPAILCTGAAIAFLSGRQANIPTWADQLYLGWFLRCLQNPKVFIPRYWNSFSLAMSLLKAATP